MLVLGVAVYTMGEVAEGATKPAPSSWSLRGPGAAPPCRTPSPSPPSLAHGQGRQPFLSFYCPAYLSTSTQPLDDSYLKVTKRK